MTAENIPPENEDDRILGLHSHLGKAWTSDDFNDELPDSFWFGDEQEKEIEEKFNTLYKAWDEETRMISSSTVMFSNPNYQEIIKMGKEVLPFIFKSLQDSPDHWFHALSQITGENPIPSEDAGRLGKMTESWLNWAKEKGYLSDSSK